MKHFLIRKKAKHSTVKSNLGDVAEVVMAVAELGDATFDHNS